MNPRRGGSPARESNIIGSIIDIKDQEFNPLFICVSVLIFMLFNIMKIGAITII